MPASDELQAPPRGQATGLGLGERLRSARKARALSVAQVAEALRLDEASILALEEERFEVLGAPVFIRGHLKRYAEIVGLAAAAVLDAYRVAAPDSDAPPSLARPREQPDALRIGAWVYWVIAAVILGGIVVSVMSSDGDAPAPATATAPPEPAQTTPKPDDSSPAEPPPGTIVAIPAPADTAPRPASDD